MSGLYKFYAILTYGTLKYVFVYCAFEVIRIYKSVVFQKCLWVQHDLSPHSYNFFSLDCFLRYIILSLSGSCFVYKYIEKYICILLYIYIYIKYIEKRKKLQSHFTWLICLFSNSLLFFMWTHYHYFPSTLLTCSSSTLLNCASFPEDHSKNTDYC